MFVSTALSVVALSLSVVALPADASSAINLPAIGSTVDYSDLPMQPLQDASAMNGTIQDADVSLSDTTAVRRRQDIDFDLVD